MTSSSDRRLAAPWRILKAVGSSPWRHLLLLGLDCTIAVGSLWTALLLRFETSVPVDYLQGMPRLTALLILARGLATLLLRLHRWSFRFSSLADAARVALAGLMGTGLWMTLIFLVGLGSGAQVRSALPRSVVVLELLITTAMLGMLRFSPRLAWLYVADHIRARGAPAVRTVIVGAGAAGEMLLRDLQRSDEHSYQVLGFVDDDTGKQRMIVGGKPVLGTVADLPAIVKEHGVANVLMAIPRLSAQRVREILALCADLKLRFKILPVSYVYLDERVSASMLQDLSPEDLLPRAEVKLEEEGDVALMRGRRVLVTGAAGSIGSEICLQLARAGIDTLVMVDLNENEMYLLQRRLERDFPDVVCACEVGDIRDRGRMDSVMIKHSPQDVFHAAAHKHVPLMETAPCEAIKNNVMGTRNVAEAAGARGVERFVYISTDKAVRPSSVMGASKRLGEAVVRALARGSATRFSVVRFGNVLGSSGSVVPLFREQIAAGKAVTVTHPEVRRYFMTIGEAVGLVLRAAYRDYGELCILEMGEQIKIADLARHMVTMSGRVPDVDIPIVFTGLRPGDKLYEELFTEEEERTQRVTEKVLVAQSPPPSPDLERRVAALERAAAAEDAAAVLTLLRELVPSYRPAPQPGPASTDDASPELPIM